MKYLLASIIVLLVACGQNNKVTNEIRFKSSPLTTPDVLYPSLFRDVQLNQVFPDGKTFVDCTAITNSDKINSDYAQLNDKSKKSILSFVQKHFEIPGMITSEFKSDKNRNPTEHINALWEELTREADKENHNSTLIPLPYSYIVPGGRFREVYYWDSYFTMLGLVESNKFDIIENMLDNFAFLISEIGHIPNGNRVYYKTRSQPPFFAQMVELMAQIKGEQYYAKYKDALLAEYNFWMSKSNNQKADKHIVEMDWGTLNRYFDMGNTPRQESYREDFELVKQYNGGEKMYKDLRSGAESGWDYSSRWFADKSSIGTIETTDILPIDLNALLYGLEDVLLKTIKEEKLKDQIKSSQLFRKKLISEYCYKKEGLYEDYNWIKQKTTGVKSLATMYPLYFKMVSQEQADVVAKYIEANFLKPGGVVTSLHHTGEQWDAPNGWAPLQWITIIGLDNYGHKNLAKEIALRWINLNEKVYYNTGKFVEKYNVEDMTLKAGGGEYPVQDGFGWSNGVYLALKSYLDEN